jgi:hypothetical protein
MLLGFVVIIIFAYQVLNNQKTDKQATGVSTETVEEKAQDTIKPITTTTKTTTVKKTAFTKLPLNLSYGPAVAAYNYRFQFVNCQIQPNALTMKVGTILMLDNRDNTKHTIGFGDYKYSFGPYDYQIFKTGAAGEYNVICDGINRGKLVVQP